MPDRPPPRTAAALVAEAGRLLHGPHWMAGLARDLDVNPRTMERLAVTASRGEEYQSAPNYLPEVLALLEARGVALETLRRAITDRIEG